MPSLLLCSVFCGQKFTLVLKILVPDLVSFSGDRQNVISNTVFGRDMFCDFEVKSMIVRGDRPLGLLLSHSPRLKEHNTLRYIVI